MHFSIAIPMPSFSRPMDPQGHAHVDLITVFCTGINEVYASELRFEQLTAVYGVLFQLSVSNLLIPVLCFADLDQ